LTDEAIPVDTLLRSLEEDITQRDAYCILQFAAKHLHEATLIRGSHLLLKYPNIVKRYEVWSQLPALHVLHPVLYPYLVSLPLKHSLIPLAQLTVKDEVQVRNRVN
jgi:hypothetical protein